MNAWQRFTQALFPKTRSLTIGAIAEQLYNQLRERETAEGMEEKDGGMYWLLDIYAGDDDLFAVVTKGGKLYRVGLIVAGTTVTLGEFVEVETTFTPVQQSRTFTVRRLADGNYRWTMIAATSVLNRVGEIDSAELFDSFVQHAERTGEYPTLDFYHMGRQGEAWEFGQADFLARDGVCYVASGLFDLQKPLGRAAVNAVITGGKAWGASIEFRAIGEPELVAAEPAIRIPVYRAGVNSRISMVLEADAAGHFTALDTLTEVSRMNKKVQQALAKLFGEDEDALAAFVAEVDGVNRTVTEQGLIHRATEDVEADIEQDEAEDHETPEGMPLLEIDDDTVAFIVQQVAQHPDVAGLVGEALAGLTALEERLATTEKALAAVTRQASDARTRLAALEADEAEKRQAWKEDLPAKQAFKVSYRPRMRRGVEDKEDETEVTGADIANNILSTLPTY